MSESTFKEELAVDDGVALDFFRTNTIDVVTKRKLSKVRNDELVYFASVHAHYALTSRFDTAWLPTPGSLVDVYHRFGRPSSVVADSTILETAGAQTLLMAGLSAEQMKLPRNSKWFMRSMGWYDDLGQAFYEKASEAERKQKKRDLLRRMSVSFTLWRSVGEDLWQSFRDNPYLLKLPPTSS